MDILEATPEILLETLKKGGFPRFRAQQVCEWIFTKRVAELDKMSNLPAPLKTYLREQFTWDLPEVVHSLTSDDDGTTKLLLRSKDQRVFETVIMRYPKRTTICIS